MSQSYIARTSGLKARDYLGYALVDAAGCLVFSLVTTLLQKFYTDIFHLSPLFIMLMFIGARVWDAVNDPIMGRICDLTPPGRTGRYRRWIAIAAGPMALLGVMMFVRFPGLGESGHMTATRVYAAVTYTLFGMAYTMLNIPYGSLASVITTDVQERNKLSVWRSVGAAVGSIPVLLIVSFANKTRLDALGNPVLGENGRPLKDMQYEPVILGVAIMAAASFLLLMLAFRMNRERVVAQPRPRQKGETLRVLKLLFRSRAFITVSLASMLLLAGQMFTQSFYTYLFADYFNASWMNLASQACTYSPMLVLMFLLPGLARRLGKKEVCAVGTAVAAAANLALFFLRGMAPGRLMWVFLALCFVSGCGLTTLVMQVWAMATDAIDDIQVKTGSRDDGTAYSVFNFFRKMGQVLSAVCVNGALLGMHYAYREGEVQTPENLKTMYDLATLIPALLFGLMALILFVWYPLSRRRVEALQEQKEQLLKGDYERRAIQI